MKLLGLKTETQSFDPRHLSFFSLIPELNSFVDNIKVPIQLSEKEEKYIFDHWKEYMRVTRDNDHFNIKFGIEIGEKIEKSVLTAIFIRNKYTSMIPIIQTLLENYSDPSFVYKMLPLKAIATVIATDEHYIQFLELFKMFGMTIVCDIIEYFEPEHFFKKLLISTLCYSRYVERQLELKDDDTNYQLSGTFLQEIIDEGKELKHLCELLSLQYPEMKYFVVDYDDHTFGMQTIDGLDEAIKWIDKSIDDLGMLKQEDSEMGNFLLEKFGSL
jgi:hypothetical protein